MRTHERTHSAHTYARTHARMHVFLFFRRVHVVQVRTWQINCLSLFFLTYFSLQPRCPAHPVRTWLCLAVAPLPLGRPTMWKMYVNPFRGFKSCTRELRIWLLFSRHPTPRKLKKWIVRSVEVALAPKCPIGMRVSVCVCVCVCMCVYVCVCHWPRIFVVVCLYLSFRFFFKSLGDETDYSTLLASNPIFAFMPGLGTETPGERTARAKEILANKYVGGQFSGPKNYRQSLAAIRARSQVRLHTRTHSHTHTLSQ